VIVTQCAVKQTLKNLGMPPPKGEWVPVPRSAINITLTTTSATTQKLVLNLYNNFFVYKSY